MSEDTKFKRLAIQRTNRAIRLIRLIGNLSNRSHYQYSTKDAKRIVEALQNEISIVKSKFQNPRGGREQQEFTLD